MLDPRDDSHRLSLPVGERDHVQGRDNAPITVLEYGDYECPYCRAVVPVVHELQRRLPDALRFVYRHFPLEHLHPHARRAAEAAEAAGAQGRFFEMHEILFANQDAMEDADLLRYADALGLDMPRFRDDLGAPDHAARIREDFVSGVRSGVRGTPTLFLDGARYDGALGLRELVQALRSRHPELVVEGLESDVASGPLPRVVFAKSMLRQ